MKIKTLVSALIAVSLASSGLAFAQGRGERNDRNHDERYDRGNGRQYDHRGYAGQDERGAGPDHQFHRGERMPREFRSSHYVVDDWRGHHLSAPPRGYHWVQTGGDYVLIAIASGIIAQLLLGR